MARLRQAVLVARDLGSMTRELRAELGLGEPFSDPAVGHFGLRNAVMAIGDTFVEVVSPAAAGTAAGRHLDRLGGDGGYMLMFEVGDLDAARDRAAESGVREVFAVELPDIADVHLHPSDMGGTIVAVDRPLPAGSWRWGGPEWEGRIPAHGPGGLRGATVRTPDPPAAAERWAHVLGTPCHGTTVPLDDGAALTFDAVAGRSPAGLAGIAVELTTRAPDGRGRVEIGGVAFDVC